MNLGCSNGHLRWSRGMQADMNFFFDTNFHKNITKTTLVFIEMIVHIVSPKSEKVKKNLQTFFKENG